MKAKLLLIVYVSATCCSLLFLPMLSVNLRGDVVGFWGYAYIFSVTGKQHLIIDHQFLRLTLVAINLVVASVAFTGFFAPSEGRPSQPKGKDSATKPKAPPVETEGYKYDPKKYRGSSRFWIYIFAVIVIIFAVMAFIR